MISTDLSIQLPKSTYGRIAPRSGLALNLFIGVGAGVVDPDYEGNVGVVLFNHSNVLFWQLTLAPIDYTKKWRITDAYKHAYNGKRYVVRRRDKRSVILSKSSCCDPSNHFVNICIYYDNSLQSAKYCILIKN